MARAFVASVVMALSLAPASSHAQALNLSLADGRVTLDAREVSLRQIMERWAEVGGVTVLNAGLLPDTPVTLQLSGSTERAALATLLRSMSGYVLGARQDGKAGAEIDRIMILPTSAAVGSSGPVVQPPPSLQPARVAADLPRQAGVVTTILEAEPTVEAEPDPGSSIAGSSIAVSTALSGDRSGAPVRPTGPPGPPEPTPRPIRFLDEWDADGNRVRAPTIPPEAAPAVGPANPFGVTSGSVTPGTIATAPKQPGQ